VPDSALFSPDGRCALTAGEDKVIRLWDQQTGKEIHRFVGHPREVTWFAVSPDGRRLLSSDYNAHELRRWDLNTHEQIDRVDLGILRRSASIKLLAAASIRPYDESGRGGARRWE
jgi:WD40 repeat protein